MAVERSYYEQGCYAREELRIQNIAGIFQEREDDLPLWILEK
jgi:hypothetical protein